jgi:peroxiredoxin
MPSNSYLKFNDPAPDLELADVSGNPVRLSSLWKTQVLILAFTRHFGCPQCKEMVDQLVTAYPELRGHNLGLAIITQATAKEAKIFCEQRASGILCLADPARQAYKAYGLERANLWQTFFSLNVWRSNRRLKRERGWSTELPPKGQDAMQMAGTFVVGQDGRIRLPYYYDDIADHPPIDLLLHGILGINWNQTFEGPVAPS